ncbi:MAG: hypothetical protein M1120_00820 [Patescibacteria group bacterium]|nr:hypothetical protein [Patescibacteria group bacterium]
MLEEEYLTGKEYLKKNYFHTRRLFYPLILITAAGLFLVANLVILDLEYLSHKNLQTTQTELQTAPASLPATPNSANTICTSNCITNKNEATPASKTQTQTVEKNVLPANNASAKEYFIPLGFGTSSKGDWQNVDGMQATINTNNFNRIKSAVLEISANIPTGNETADFRLFNSSDQHPVWFSDTNISGGTTQFLTSAGFALDSGNKTYVLQAKTSLKYPVNINMARIHLVTY